MDSSIFVVLQIKGDRLDHWMKRTSEKPCRIGMLSEDGKSVFVLLPPNFPRE